MSIRLSLLARTFDSQTAVSLLMRDVGHRVRVNIRLDS